MDVLIQHCLWHYFRIVWFGLIFPCTRINVYYRCISSIMQEKSILENQSTNKKRLIEENTVSEHFLTLCQAGLGKSSQVTVYSTSLGRQAYIIRFCYWSSITEPICLDLSMHTVVQVKLLLFFIILLMDITTVLKSLSVFVLLDLNSFKVLFQNR